jgi:lipoprotein-anchoring transpeptidase ErfK/SrfK
MSGDQNSQNWLRNGLSRRHLLASALSGCAALIATVPAAASVGDIDDPYPLPPFDYGKLPAPFRRATIGYTGRHRPGTIIVDTSARQLTMVLEGGQAIRIGVGVGREGFGWTGTVHVGGKQEAPKWFPPPEMIARQPELAKYEKEGMPGGEGNPLGVRALYLYDDKGKDTLYRIHGTIEPWSIGLNVSSGCIRMLNENVTTLYDMVDVGTKVIVM